MPDVIGVFEVAAKWLICLGCIREKVLYFLELIIYNGIVSEGMVL